jgi:hypothetical protein
MPGRSRCRHRMPGWARSPPGNQEAAALPVRIVGDRQIVPADWSCHLEAHGLLLEHLRPVAQHALQHGA